MTDNVESAEGNYRYDPVDDHGLAQCVYCGVTFGAEDHDHAIANEVNLTSGPVVRANSGIEADIVLDTAPESELVHPDCWTEIVTEQRKRQNVDLGQFA